MLYQLSYLAWARRGLRSGKASGRGATGLIALGGGLGSCSAGAGRRRRRLALLVSGGSGADPRTPAALPGLPPPFLGTAVVGDGGLTAAIDAYGDVVDLRAPGPAGPALIDNPADAAGGRDRSRGHRDRAAGRVGGGPALPLWRADSVRQRYLPGTNVVRTTARFGREQVSVRGAAGGSALSCCVAGRPGPRSDADGPRARRRATALDRAEGGSACVAGPRRRRRRRADRRRGGRAADRALARSGAAARSRGAGLGAADV